MATRPRTHCAVVLLFAIHAPAEAAVTVNPSAPGAPWPHYREVAPRMQEASDRVPLALASGDVDGDGMPDVVVSLATPDGRGELVVYPGNVDYLFPNEAAARARRSVGLPVDQPLLPAWPAVAVAVPLDQLVMADLDADGRSDVVGGARGTGALLAFDLPALRGIGQPHELPLAGGLTALASGEIARRDGLAELAVAVDHEGQGELWVLAPGRRAPQMWSLPGLATAVAVGRVDADRLPDVAALLGDRVAIAFGRDRSNSSTELADRLVIATLDTPAETLLIAEVLPELSDRRPELLVLDAQGGAVVIEAEGGELALSGRTPPAFGAQRPSANRQVHALPARLAVSPSLSLLVTTGPSSLTATTINAEGEVSQLTASLGAPLVDAIGLRLNVDALDDLVVLLEGSATPYVVVSAPLNSYLVENTGVLPDCNTADNFCSTDLGQGGGCGSGGCTLRAALQQAAATPGPDSVTFGLGGTPPFVINDADLTVAAGTTLDATTQAGYAGSPVIILRGAHGINSVGLLMNEGANVVRGFSINSHQLGLWTCTGSGDIVEGNIVGVPQHLVGDTNDSGIWVGGCPFAQAHDTLVGGTTPAARNIVAGNTGVDFLAGGQGASAHTHDMTVVGNWFGIDSSGVPPEPATARAESNAKLCLFHGGSFGGIAAGAGNLLGGGDRADDAAFVISDCLHAQEDLIVLGNAVGVDASGSVSGTSGLGARLGGTTDLLSFGAPGGGNQIVGAAGAGVQLNQLLSNTTVQGNWIGLLANGTAAGHGADGVFIENYFSGGGAAITIGGANLGEANTIANNVGAGVRVFLGLRNQVGVNEIRDNGGLAIDLDCAPFGACAGPTVNDPGDPDDCGLSCGNALQNYPDLAVAGGTFASGTLDSNAAEDFTIDVYAAPTCPASGRGDLDLWLGSLTTTTNIGGIGTFAGPLSVAAPPGWVIAATATDVDGNTSEPSPCLAATDSLIFADGFESGSTGAWSTTVPAATS